MNFFDELKRRRVFKVGLAYLALAWVLVEASSTIAPMMQLPDWAAPMMLYVSIIGFPVALVLTWMFQLTDHGLMRQDELDLRGRDIDTGAARFQASSPQHRSDKPRKVPGACAAVPTLDPLQSPHQTPCYRVVDRLR